MPYMKKGKCVYKKNQDGSQGKKVGCTKGSVEDYLKALHANTDGETKKENKSMKIKKSELLALIKEEIMKEAPFGRGMTMMDDPYDDNEPQPASMQSGGAMDQAFEYILTDVEKSLDFPAGALVNYLVTQNPEASPDAVGSMAVQVLETLGMNFPTEQAVEEYITREMDDIEDDMMQERKLKEGFNPDDVAKIAAAMEQLAPLIGTMSLPVIIGLIFEKLKEMGAK
jgi:hypothetical protein